MIRPMYAVRDLKSCWLTPSIDDNDQVARRGFVYAVSHNDIMGFVPEHFSLYKIGAYDLDTGHLLPLEVPELIIEGSEAVSIARHMSQPEVF